ncbi:MAG: DctP family TRAP transporter solute-binding subunit, partial [Lachnospiraceae bacterium]|nr:DctP family TRAP transporter solute-binding subunit [Lachnospiraceae bacterium]
EAFGCTVSDVDQAEWIEATKSVYDDASLGIDADLLAKIQDVVAGVQASLEGGAPAAEAAPAEEAPAAAEAAAPAGMLPPVLTEPVDADPLGSPDATVRLKCGDTNAMTSAYNQGLVALRNHLEELSGGTMTIDVYPSSSLGNESDMLDAVSMGTQDMLVTSTGPIPAFAKSTANWAVLDLPYLFPTYESAYEVLDGEVGQQLLAGFDGTGIKALAFWENGYRCTTNSKKEIVHPDDLKGMKIRTMENKVHMATYTALGATPTAMAMGEVFSALQQGTIDGQENPYAIIYYGNKLHEIQPYITQNDVFYSPAVLAISEDVFNGLTEEQQGWLLEASELAKHEQRAIERGMQQMGRKNMEAFGCTVSDVDQAEWIEATKSVYDDASLGIDADLLAKIQAVTGAN